MHFRWISNRGLHLTSLPSRLGGPFQADLQWQMRRCAISPGGQPGLFSFQIEMTTKDFGWQLILVDVIESIHLCHRGAHGTCKTRVPCWATWTWTPLVPSYFKFHNITLRWIYFFESFELIFTFFLEILTMLKWPEK